MERIRNKDVHLRVAGITRNGEVGFNGCCCLEYRTGQGASWKSLPHWNQCCSVDEEIDSSLCPSWELFYGPRREVYMAIDFRSISR
jgi:hypothetical protein